MCASDLRRHLILVLLAASLALPAAGADKTADRAKEQLRRMQQSQRKLEQEKARLTQEKTALEGQFKDAEGQLKNAEGKLDAARRQAEAAARKAAGLEKELATALADKEALTAKLADAAQKLTRLGEQQRATEAERKRLDALAAQQKQSIASCEEHNAKLHAQGVALLEKYQSKSCFETVLQGEPFTGLKQVEIENFVEDSREKLDEHKLDPQASR